MSISQSVGIKNARRKSIAPPKQQPFELKQRRTSAANKRPVLDGHPPLSSLSISSGNILPAGNSSLNSPISTISNINNFDPDSKISDGSKSKSGDDDEYINALETEILQLEMIQVNNE